MSPNRSIFPIRAAAGDNRRHLVLLAIADRDLRALGKSALHGAGFQVMEARRAEEVQPLVRARRPDAIVVGDDLPGGALETCRATRASAQARDLPIFCLLSERRARPVEEAFAAGATDVLAKPIVWPLLVHRLERTLGTWRLLNRLREDRFSLEEAQRKAFDASDAMLRLKHYDHLTGLPNRTLFQDFLALALARADRQGGKVGVLYLDIDGFKEINETLGRQQGDDLLRQVGKRLRRALRSGDHVAREPSAGMDAAVARLSGDEFVLLIQKAGGRRAIETVAARLMEAMAGPFTVQQKRLHLSAGVGIAVAPDDGDDEETLIQRAETAMFHAKRKGPRSRLFFEPSMKSAVVHKLEVKQGLRRALEEDGFVLHYQPLLDASGTITGLEALLRWPHPERGLVPPDEFIPVAEDTGLMTSIGTWVLNEVCRQLGEWAAGGVPPVPVSVNIAQSQLEQPDFVATVLAILRQHGTDPSLLKFELSERGVLRNDPDLLQLLEDVRATGIRLAIDDFGIGQTSLAYLRRFPLDVIKIDRSFVVGLTRNEDDDAIASAIIAMARRLDLRVVAEGVETEAQAAFLQSHGCDELQGFLYYRPMPPAEFAAVQLQPNPLKASA